MLVDDVDGVEAGRERCIMGARDEMLTVGCQTSDRLQLVVAHPGSFCCGSTSIV